MPAHTMHAAACSHYSGYCLYSAICSVVATASNSAPNETRGISTVTLQIGTDILSAMQAWPDPGKASCSNCVYFSCLGINKSAPKHEGGVFCC